MAPTFEDAVVRGPLNPSERKVLSVIERKYDYVWSRKLNDLVELACWAEFPDAKTLPKFQPIGGTPITLNSKIAVTWMTETIETPTLRTIATALQTLAEGQRIWAGELYDTRYYGNKHHAFKRLEAELGKLGPSQRQKAGFKTLDPDNLPTTDDEKPEV